MVKNHRLRKSKQISLPRRYNARPEYPLRGAQTQKTEVLCSGMSVETDGTN